MIRRSMIIALLFGMIHSGLSQETPKEKAQRMEWFKDAKLGIFIHYGIYAVNGIDESWSFFNGYISHKDYMKQLDGFTAANYRPDEWAELFTRAGAKYAVLTSKHHDGVALWDSQYDHYTTVKHTPAGKDLVDPFTKALRNKGLKVGLYYSLIDWSHPDYPGFTREQNRYEDDPVKWAAFKEFYLGQLNELSTQFNPDLYWFDGDWEHSAEAWDTDRLKRQLRSHNPHVIVNSRVKEGGDYETPEQGVPVRTPSNPYWELCLTINDSWGYQYNDHNYKTPFQLVRIFADCISKGGNLLLNIGPKEDGSIPPPQVEVLEEFARWTGKHAEAIYGTRAGIDEVHFPGMTALSKDHRTLFLYIDNAPNHPLQVKGLLSEVSNVRVVGTHQAIDYNYTKKTGSLQITLPGKVLDPAITVIAIDLKSPLTLSTPQEMLTAEFLEKLEADSRWYEKHAPVLENSTKGISSLHYAGHSLLSMGKDILYLLVDGQPNGPLMIKGLKNKINRIWVVGNGTKLDHNINGQLYWSHVPGIAYIDLPEQALDPSVTVIAVLLDGPVALYSEEGQVIESN
ncbi:alpha-L-fucosidase [Geofilum rubicundum]|uniref:alpha-L-fucosidase n=1 Tax=Geofilum rubicundum JCM 15548 TaxID=1236989 RepID=A0A0E9LXP6_9BACT|nr:alpha-L-fucosidase [Geofilum rubicundum]GAO30073.1 alpha-L-fucosidase [Geofilum rubicundum JCM 15548]